MRQTLFYVSLLAFLLHFVSFMRKLFDVYEVEKVWSLHTWRTGKGSPDDRFYELAKQARTRWGDVFLSLSLLATLLLLSQVVMDARVRAGIGWTTALSLLLAAPVLLSLRFSRLRRTLDAPILPLGYQDGPLREYYSRGILMLALSGISSGVTAFVLTSLHLT